VSSLDIAITLAPLAVVLVVMLIAFGVYAFLENRA
jgi:hypothetical protein